MKVYLAGPDVFRPDAEDVGESKKRICREHGFEGLFPLDNVISKELGKAERARAIFRANRAQMDRAELIIASLTPFRGVGMDPGTAFEIGYMHAQRKPVFAYTDAEGTYLDRAVRAGLRTATDPARDADGLEIEDFDLADNLMPAGAARESGIDVVTGADDLAAFRACVRLAAERFRPGG